MQEELAQQGIMQVVSKGCQIPAQSVDFQYRVGSKTNLSAGRGARLLCARLCGKLLSEQAEEITKSEGKVKADEGDHEYHEELEEAGSVTRGLRLLQACIAGCTSVERARVFRRFLMHEDFEEAFGPEGADTFRRVGA